MLDGFVSGTRARRSWRVWAMLAVLGVLGLATMLCALICGLVIAGFEAIAGEYTHGRAQAFDMPLATRILYGGTVEEIVFRWGLLSVLALAAAKLRARPAAAFWIANLIVAALFGAGHIPG